MKISPTVAVKFHKFRAKRTTCLHGHNHPSQKEAMWCVKLHQLEQEGKISGLVREPEYELIVDGVLICKHRPDFAYSLVMKIKGDDVLKQCIVEVKGMQTPEWKLKHKLFCALFPSVEYQVM